MSFYRDFAHFLALTQIKTMKKAIIVGATSGIGRSLAYKLYQEGYQLGITGRREERLREIAENTDSSKVIYQVMDVTRFEESIQTLQRMIESLGGLDLFVFNSGIGGIYPDREYEMNVIDTNAKGFLSLTRWVFDYFRDRKLSGQIVGVSSIMKIRGYRKTAAYCATKAFMSSYMQGLRHISATKNLGIAITDIRPGFVMTEMTEKNRGMFWVATADKAAQQIYVAIKKKKKVAYVTRRWNLIVPIFRFSPDFIYNQV